MISRRILAAGVAAWTSLFLLTVIAEAGGQEKLRGYTIMAGGLGRSPSGPDDMWPNTVEAHLNFIEKARINLVVIEVPYGVNRKNPKSSSVANLIKKLKGRGVEVWNIYPHCLADAFNLPRQVDSRGQRVSWNTCNNHPEVQKWLTENGRAIVEAYQPDGLVLFGTFHVGGACRCDHCRKNRDEKKSMEAFFSGMREAVRSVGPQTKLGTCCFWTEPNARTLASIDMVCPVVSVWRPGYEGPGRIKGEAGPLKKKYKGKRIVPYVKLFLARQTNSKTEDILAAAKEGIQYCDGFFYWGYNPGHCYRNQEYDHGRIAEVLRDAAGPARKKRNGRKKPKRTPRRKNGRSTQKDNAAERQSILDRINAYRRLAGLDPVEGKEALTGPIQAHLDYMIRNKKGGHDEDPSLPGYTKEGAAAGRKSLLSTSKSGPAAVDNLINSLHHRIPLLWPSYDCVGVGCANWPSGSVLVGIDWQSGIKVVPRDCPLQCVIYPVDGQVDVPLAFMDESPSPWPPGAKRPGGCPITLTFVGSLGRAKITNVNVTLKDGRGDV
ncbi:MAG: CAP domain-containing protein, partial [Planctomycetota bacterium]